jgi:hypothetical protein
MIADSRPGRLFAICHLLFASGVDCLLHVFQRVIHTNAGTAGYRYLY